MSNNYATLRTLQRNDPDAADRCSRRLLNMRKDLKSVTKRRNDGSLLLATWNIRDFDSNKFRQGPRLPETFFYIAEIISCFDLVALQEVNRDLSALQRVMQILGREWDFIATDTTEGPGGNAERMAFVYNTEKVFFRQIAGEIVLPQGQLIVSPAKTQSATDAQEERPVEDALASGLTEVHQQFARTPFVVAFQSGWFKFNLCTVHIYYGEDSGPGLQRRINEIRRLVEFMTDRQDRENEAVDNDPARAENYILLGDFNVVSPEHETMQALQDRGFTVPPAIDGDKIRTPEDHFYDQIAVRVADPSFRVVTGNLVDMYESVFRDNATDRRLYGPFMPPLDAGETETDEELAKRYLKWRTWQMSDHHPLWIEIDTDYADHYLEQFAKE
jgi:endonuclease/exonuclease/phosphatase family metal-dependent hydrolase